MSVPLFGLQPCSPLPIIHRFLCGMSNRYLFQASSGAELQAWLAAIQQAINICTPQERIDFKQVDFP
jgi:hypothetical protein